MRGISGLFVCVNLAGVLVGLGGFLQTLALGGDGDGVGGGLEDAAAGGVVTGEVDSVTGDAAQVGELSDLLVGEVQRVGLRGGAEEGAVSVGESGLDGYYERLAVDGQDDLEVHGLFAVTVEEEQDEALGAAFGGSCLTAELVVGIEGGDFAVGDGDAVEEYLGYDGHNARGGVDIDVAVIE